jgi:hypothetical protein
MLQKREQAPTRGSNEEEKKTARQQALNKFRQQ